MGDLSTIVGTVPETVQRIYDWHKREGDAEPARGYLGASIIGHHCDRYLWYTFRGCVKRDFDGRMYRLFETGDLAESRFANELRAIGCEVRDLDEQGGQFAVYAVGGHLSGHMDAAVLGIPEAPKTWHVGEFKTHNAKSFAELKAKGVKASKPQHYAQMQVYMGLTHMNRALYLAVNKDTDELWVERVEFNSSEFGVLIQRAERIIQANTPPERCATRSDSFSCKFCDAFNLCWGMVDEAAVPIPARTCRTCCHATPEIDEHETDARWSCAKLKKDLSPLEQDKACDGHLLLPGLISFAEPVDAGPDWIEFANAKDAARWRHGQGDGLWSTLELMGTPGPAVGDSDIEAVKAAFGGTCRRTPLVDQYPPNDSELLWGGNPDEIGEALEVLGLGDLMKREPTRKEDADGRIATEFVGAGNEGRDILVVIYVPENAAAVWEGKR